MGLATWCVAWLCMLFLLVNVSYLFATALYQAAVGESELSLVPAYGYLMLWIAYISSATPRFK